MEKMVRDSIVIDIPVALPPVEWPECCIYRVPKQLQKVNKEAYTPKLVSIGPFHHGRKTLAGMENHKLRYLREFCYRTGKSQEDLRKIVEDNEVKIRRCYSEDCRPRSSTNFVDMILWDAIFIIELFLKDEDKRKKEKAERLEKAEEEKAERIKGEKAEEEKAESIKGEKAEEEKAERIKGEKAEEEKDYILSKPWMKHVIFYDLILLENQLPFFLLQDLYTFAFSDSSSLSHDQEGQEIKERKEDTSFLKLSCSFFSRSDEEKMSNIGGKVKHFTDLLRYLFCPLNMKQWSIVEGSPALSKKEKRRNLGTRFCATKLYHAGLKFKVKDDRRLLDIRLPGCLGRFPCVGYSCLFACLPCLICLICFPSLTCLLGCFKSPMYILEVPQLVIDYDTEAIFRNLMALEQCHYPSSSYISNYVLLLDRLIDTERDVDLLVDKDVIANRLGSNAAVADLINKLGEQIVATTSSYDQIHITQQLSRHYEYPFNHFLATLKREYFPNIFRGTTTVVGLIVLGFTLWNFIKPFAV